MRNVLLVAMLLATPAARAANDPLRVLFVGNSLTYVNNMPRTLEQIAKSLDARPPLVAHFAGAGGRTLKQQYFDRHVTDEIRDGHYAVVVLQAQSSEVVYSFGETSYYAKLLDDAVRRSGAKTVIFTTWAPQNGHFTQSEFDRKYEQLARNLHAELAPVALAWQKLESDGIRLTENDGVHPNARGSYLIACVFFSLLEHRSPAGAARPDGVSAGMAEVIEREAWRTVSRHGD